MTQRHERARLGASGGDILSETKRQRRPRRIGPLLRQLERWQGELGYSHARFAIEVLSVTRAQWAHLRHGARQPSQDLMGRLLQQRPELAYWVSEQIRWSSRRQGTEAA